VTTARTATAPEHSARWEDYIDVFVSPTALFRRRAHDSVLPPLLTLFAIGLLFYVLLLPANGMVMRAGARDEDALAAIDRMGTFMAVAGAVMVPVLYSMVIGTAAFLLWVGGRVADISTDFGRMLLIATYAAFVYLLSQVFGGAAALLHGEAGLDLVRDMSFGPLRFVGNESMNPALMALLRRFDIFNVWQAVLWAIGLRVLYGVTAARAAAVAAAAWILFIIPMLVGNALGAGRG
jgi:hypothetical protein